MTDLRQAAQQALEALEEFCEAGTMLRPIERREALRKALEQQAEPVQKPKYMAQSNGRHSPLLTHMMNKRTALAEPEQSFEDEQRVINADNHRRANALEEAIHAAWSAGYVEGEKATLEQQAEPVAWQVMVEDEAMKEFPIKDMAYDWCIQQKLYGSSYVYWIRPLYTAPPQRKPLTDEEIEKHWKKWVGTARPNYSYTRAIEQAHGIKEGT